MAAIPAASTTTWTAAQLKEIAPEAIGAITPEQVEVMGSEITDPKLSALAFLTANSSKLAPETFAALKKRVPELVPSSAASFSVSAAAAVAVAALAFLA